LFLLDAPLTPGIGKKKNVTEGETNKKPWHSLATQGEREAGHTHGEARKEDARRVIRAINAVFAAAERVAASPPSEVVTSQSASLGLQGQEPDQHTRINTSS
jgi:hypothetical protein